MDRPFSLQHQRIDLATEPAFDLGRARIEPSAHEISIGGRTQRMQPQTLKVLIALHDKSSRVMTRQELIDRCWDGRIIGEDVINRCISVLRRFEAEAGGFRIETVPRAGYRLTKDENLARSGRAKLQIAAAIGLILAFTGAAYFWPKPAPSTSGVTIALFPFTAETGQSSAREIADAARQALAGTLTKEGFAVRNPGTADSVPEIAIRANVIRAADLIQVTASVEKGSRPVTLASLQFDATVAEAGSLPQQIGAQVAAAVSFTSALDGHAKDTASAESLQQLTTLTLGGDSLTVYRVALKIVGRAPDSALAQLLLGMSTGLVLGDIPLEQRSRALAAGRRAVERAHALAPDLGLDAVAWCKLHSQIRMAECESRLRAGLRTDPASPLLHQYLSEQLAGVGRSEEALRFARIGYANESYMPDDIARLLRSLEATGHPGEAERIYKKSGREWPKYDGFFWSRVGGMLERGDVHRLARFEAEHDSRARIKWFETPLLLTAIRAGDLPTVKRECRVVSDPSVRIVQCMLGLAQLGDLNGSYRIADQLYPRLVGKTPSEEETLWLRQWEGPPYQYLMGLAAEPMRRDARFLAVAERTGLLGYWRTNGLPDFCVVRHESVCAKLPSGMSRNDN